MKKMIVSGKNLMLLLIILFSTVISVSQNNEEQANSNNEKLSVFLDLSYWADDDYIRQQIPVVQYVRDKELADVHIIMTRHAAGQSGINYIISLSGSGDFKGTDNELKYWSPSEHTQHETRLGYTNMIRIGLAPYIANKHNNPDQISLQFEADTVFAETGQNSDRDPWRRWVFEVYGGGYYDAEKTRNSLHIRYGFYADKVTKDWKIRARPYFNYNERNYEIEDSTVTTVTHRDGFHGYAIRSVSDHWSVGVFTDVLSSTYHNMDFQLEVSPGIEYSFYPYREATRRSIAIAYKIDNAYNDYMQETILGEEKELLWGQSLVLTADFRQTWGSIRAGVTGSHHFHDFNSNRLELFSEVDIRLFKGFALTFNADFEFINDLVAIPAGEMSTEEILLEQRRRSTNYEFDGHIGFTYTFGSEQSGDYNPRLQ
ncbi:MAG: hypothetical protein ACQESX_07845 [Bacteroidota bacterium]